MATFEHYKQVVPANYFHIVVEHETVGAPDVQLCTWGVATPTGLMTTGILTQLADAWADNIVVSMSVDTVFTRIVASDAGGVVAEFFVNVPGSDATDAAPINSAAIVEKRSGVSGRRNRGRMYIPVLNEAFVDIAGNIDPTIGAAFQLQCNAFLADVQGAAGIDDMVILHSKGWNGGSEPADPGNAPAPTVVTQLVLKSKIGTQRRRLR